MSVLADAPLASLTYCLLDDAQARPGLAASRYYSGYRGTLACAAPEALETFWAEVEVAQRDGAQVVVLADFEYGVRLCGVESRHKSGELRVALFERCELLDRAGVDDLLARLEGAAPPGAVALRALRPNVDPVEFDRAIDAILAAIRAGETYQVNYTYRLDGWCAGDPVALYRRLRERQPVSFGALMALPDAEGVQRHILSLSPELFVRHSAGRLEARPMKGTAPRHADRASDLLAREELAQPKNRAENLMIVDLLRNDLGRVAEVGSVEVPALFEIEAHPTLWQMTSTVTARLRRDTGFAGVLRALFPCGSVTGAPKHRTLQLIERLEVTPRGPYCGAIGWVEPPIGERACGDFCLSVPIRTLTLEPPRAGWRALRLGIGAGIVADSIAAQEHAECELKARFLTGLDTGFALIETLRAERGAVALLARHLVRLTTSAQALGFRCDADAIAQAIAARAVALPPNPHRLRLELDADGHFRLTSDPLPPAPAVVRIALAALPIDPEGEILGHKTTVRSRYQRSLAEADAQGLFDLIHFNPRGELTEGARTNLFLRRRGAWLTPPLQCGVLPGVMRAELLADLGLGAREAILTPDDLAAAEAIMVCNALRGALSAVFVPSDPS